MLLNERLDKYFKDLGEKFYTDIEDLIQGIKTQNGNTYSKFRITFEEILRKMNNRNLYLKQSHHQFYNNMLNSRDFKRDLISPLMYNCDDKMLQTLKNVQIKGNEVTHNKNKYYDEEEVKEDFYQLVLLVCKFLNCHDKLIRREISKKEFNKIFEELKSKDNKHIELNKNDVLADIKNLEQKIIRLINNKDDNEIIINSYKEIFLIVINYIINVSINYNSIEDLSIGEYKTLYEDYRKLDNLVNYDNKEIYDFLYEYTYDLKKYSSRVQIDIFEDMYNIFRDNESHEESSDFENIFNAIDSINDSNIDSQVKGVYYVNSQKKKIYNNNEYYIIELNKALKDNERGETVYSKIKLREDCALHLTLNKINVRLFDNKTSIYVVNDYKVSIRPSEIKWLIYIESGIKISYPSKTDKFYIALNNYMQMNNASLYDIVRLSEKKFKSFVNEVSTNANHSGLFINSLKFFRLIIENDEYQSGANILTYFLNRLRNNIIREQKSTYPNEIIKNMYLSKGSLRFDRNPFTFSLLSHNPKLRILLDIFDNNKFKSDIFIRKCYDQMLEKNKLFIEIDDENLSEVDSYNISIDKTNFPDGKYSIINDYLYKNDEVNKIKTIFDFFKNYDNNVLAYKTILDNRKDLLTIDDSNKKDIIDNIFKDNKYGFILGEAGSGKTELICNYFSKLFLNSYTPILYLTNTHSCLNNLKRRVDDKIGIDKSKMYFDTIFHAKKYLRIDEINPCLIVIDECMSICNEDFCDLINKINLLEIKPFLIFSGDVGQLDSIKLGNWFELVSKKFNSVSYELTNNYRTTNRELLDIWNMIRRRDNIVLDYLKKNNFIKTIDSSITNEKYSDDEVILCLNYAGTYGIKSMNKYLQDRNPNKEFINGLDVYKIDDPVVFNENAKEYNDSLYNNLKGRIRDIIEKDDLFEIIVRVDTYIDSNSNQIVIKNNRTKKWTDVRINIRKYNSDSEVNDENEKKYLVPFTLSYAMSIHKAQGLEYDSVKIIITPESEEILDNEIIYTAITRAKKHLVIYITSNESLNKLENIIMKTKEKNDLELLELIGIE